jgi:hypothetical protein
VSNSQAATRVGGHLKGSILMKTCHGKLVTSLFDIFLLFHWILSPSSSETYTFGPNIWSGPEAETSSVFLGRITIIMATNIEIST